MDIDLVSRNIREIYQTISGRSDSDVYIIYSGKDYGIVKPWKARIDAREANEETYDKALNVLLSMLKKELADKIKLAESEITKLKQVFNQTIN